MLQEVLWLRLHKRLASWGRGTDETPAIWHRIREGLLVHCGVWLPVPTDEQEERSLVYWEIGRQPRSGIPCVYVALSIDDLTGLEVWSRIYQGNWFRHGPLARYVKLRLHMRRECRERFPRHRGLAILTCITARAWRTCRDACRDG